MIGGSGSFFGFLRLAGFARFSILGSKQSQTTCRATCRLPVFFSPPLFQVMFKTPPRPKKNTCKINASKWPKGFCLKHSNLGLSLLNDRSRSSIAIWKHRRHIEPTCSEFRAKVFPRNSLVTSTSPGSPGPNKEWSWKKTSFLMSAPTSCR